MSQQAESVPTSSRTEAVHELERIETQGAYVGLSRRQRKGTAEDEGKITDLVSGVTRWRRRLDFLIDHLYSGNPTGLELRIRIVLRIGLYEILFTHAPDHAVVNEAVETARSLVGKRATGLVNGILRSALRTRENLPEPDTASTPERLGIHFSHPSWMVERWLGRYGEDETRQLLEHNNTRPFFGLRLRGPNQQHVLERLRAAGADTESSPFFEDFVRTQSLQSVFREGLIEDGSLLVQDEGAAAVIRALDPQPGERILDTCAAPGGKSMYIADRVGPEGQVVGVDRHASRLRMLETESKRLELTQITTHTADFTSIQPDDLGGLFDRVLVDAPCSGLGVLSKRADLRWRIRPREILKLCILQQNLLLNAARFVRPGGVLVYSTCTIEPEENEGVIEKFSEETNEFLLQSVRNLVPDMLIGKDGFLHSLPHRHGIDGAFAARFTREP